MGSTKKYLDMNMYGRYNNITFLFNVHIFGIRWKEFLSKEVHHVGPS